MRDVDRLDHPAGELGGGNQQPVVGTDQNAVVGEPQGDRPTLGADVWVDNRQMDSDRQIGQRLAQHQCPREDIVTRNAVREIDDTAFGAQSCHHRVADAHEVVDQSVIGQERDHRRGHSGIFPQPCAAGCV